LIFICFKDILGKTPLVDFSEGKLREVAKPSLLLSVYC
jgi:hypothetical protein